MKLGIGTAQFGLDYGISNQEGKTPPEEVAKILELAAQHGVRVIDTAPLYGSSEKVLGKTLPCKHSFDIVTKTPQFLNSSITIDDAQFLEDTFRHSLSKTGQSSIYGLLVHNVGDLLKENGCFIIKRLLSLKQQGWVNKVGVSVYTSQQIERVLEKYSIDIIQLPINVLDQRLLSTGHLTILKQAGVEIHARSIFLQGLLLMKPEDLPSHFDLVREHLKKYHNFLKTRGVSAVEAALNFVAALSEINIVLCGINNYQQLYQIIELMKNTSSNCLGKHLLEFAFTETSILNPSEWRW